MILFRTTTIHVGIEKKTPREQSRSDKKIGAVWCSFEASAMPLMHLWLVDLHKLLLEVVQQVRVGFPIY
ncbi:hypothetical protein [Treponema sp. OMZ 838]|uniref:hypothetical protein n=1 Tax=Treponema sp. OMZ 838 TaxID=1539298 RepID=UPI000ABEA11E|nr:hypothetical protein [Treponema sp. OMZ 838]